MIWWACMGSVESVTTLVTKISTRAADEPLVDDNNAWNTRAFAREKDGGLDDDFALNTFE